MTHFTVLVKAELESGDLADMEGRIAEMIDPYDEGKEMARRKEYFDAEGIRRMAEHYKVDMTQPALQALQQLVPHLQDWDGADGGIDFDENNTPMLYRWTTYNEDSKWDWYQIGGRWQGMLRLHVGKMGLTGNTGLMTERGEGFDIAFLKDVDFAGMSKKDKDRAVESYYNAVAWLVKELDSGKDINDCIGTLYWEYSIEDETLEEYVARHGQFSTHAVLDEEGWHEWSEMGWFGGHHDETESEGSWSTKFAERFLSNPTDKTVIAIVDCHI